ncbi:hypothetical protein WJX84_007278 [Apatococcus fuscideae]|uniref:PAS domain-containing protein n=1 Tax=Apatococcus fuscideae TaxID=2026836 RepID=A0AAW1SWL7_9CHLO
MGQACIKGPKSAGRQEQSHAASGDSLEHTAAKQPEVHIPEGLDSTNLPEAKESYDAADIQARSAQVRDPLEPISITASGNGHLPAAFLASTIPSSITSASVDQSGRRVVSGSSSHSEAETDGLVPSEVELLRNYTQLAEMLTFSPYALMLIDIEVEAQPVVFASQALLKLLGLLDDELLDKPWREVLRTPFRHEAHSDVQGRIQEAFETGCEFRETAACLDADQELMTLQLLFLPVAKDPESGITHYICIIVAHNEGKTGNKGHDASSPVPLPKLPVNLDDVPTARQSLSMKVHQQVHN